MNNAPHIAIVDDYEDIRDLVGQYLRQHGYHVTTCENASSPRLLLEVETPDLIVLDVMMPGEDGLSLCRHLRSHTDIPIIFLSAMTEDLDVILGLELGADDYLAKPFNPRELLARIKAILRRAQRPVATPVPAVSECVRFGQWTFNRKLRELIGSDGVSTPLSSSEFKLLCVFVDHPDQVLTRDDLLEQVAGRQQDYFDRRADYGKRSRSTLNSPSTSKPIGVAAIRSRGWTPPHEKAMGNQPCCPVYFFAFASPGHLPNANAGYFLG